MNKVELKPCPFCDSDNVEILPYVDSFTKNGIRCLNCECVTTFEDCKHTDDELAQLWNNRNNKKYGKWIGYTRYAYLNILDKNDNPIERECKYYRCDKCRFGLVYKSNYCPNCGQKWRKEMTNREKINQMNNDDFIKFLDNHYDCQYCSYKNTECWEIDVNCDEGFRIWLEQEAVEDD